MHSYCISFELVSTFRPVITELETRDTVCPAIIASYAVSGLSALLSVLCYTEFAVEIPVAGGSSLLRLELGISSRSSPPLLNFCPYRLMVVVGEASFKARFNAPDSQIEAQNIGFFYPEEEIWIMKIRRFIIINAVIGKIKAERKKNVAVGESKLWVLEEKIKDKPVVRGPMLVVGGSTIIVIAIAVGCFIFGVRKRSV
ncbi:hypothetical protein SASPL_156400 [Salvia splendens]|uniref:Uncharacterized protein n=1 Tax=Salvia splendens TaxID=180675 RepID=A0A8X8YW34_SALSN|nr:hypothetical protein SASPL_156400 [Salvia splendens]